MTAYEIAKNLFDNSDTMDDLEYRMTVEEAMSILRECRSYADDDEEKNAYDRIAAEDVAEEYNNLVEKFLILNAEFLRLNSDEGDAE